MPILHWLNDEEARKTSSKLPYRLLEADTKNSFGDSDSENMLIQGDNLEALKALLPYHAGQVKCIYIDPPYNTKSAFQQYDDNLEHSTWLSTIYPRLEMLRDLLSDDGSIWVSIDDNEGHYLKVLMDEVFGRQNFLANIVWQSKDTPGNNSSGIAQTHNHILSYKKSNVFKPNLLARTEKQLSNYTNPDNDPRGDWLGTPLTRVEHRDRDYYAIRNRAGKEVFPPKGSSWRRPPIKMKELEADNRIWWGKNGDAEFPMEKKFLSEVKEGVVNQTWWSYEFAGSTRNASAEMKFVFEGNKAFDTPKPEKLIRRILELCTSTNDLVLDSFLGSGTTAAVAHKMGRRYIGIEMGDHAITHCAPRLQKVIEGDQGGISKDVNWQGGGGFNFYRLSETVFDEQGHINSKVKFKSLAVHVWFSETHTPLLKTPKTPLLGVHNETAFYLLYNGILGDKTPTGGNVLTARVLRELPKHKSKKIIYGEMCMLDEAALQKQEITFKHIPYDIKAR